MVALRGSKPPSMAPIRIIQININRCKAAHGLLEQFIKEKRIDLVVIIEPNKRIATSSDYIVDNNVDVAIKVVNKNLGIGNCYSGSGMAMIDMESIRIIGCYFSPNKSLNEFKIYIDLLEGAIKQNPNCIIAADFNAKSIEWGCTITDHRGLILEDLMATNLLTAVNEGSTATFEINNRSSIVDVTLAPEARLHQITGWKVLDTETLSDHKYVYFEFNTSRLGAGHLSCPIPGRFDSRTLKEEKFVSLVEGITCLVENATQLENIIQDICQKTMKRTGTGNKKAVYWWSEEIKILRANCIQFRRQASRIRRSPRYSNEEKESCLKEYKENRNRLKKAITKAKESKWKDVIDEVENDVWGTGYKVVQKKFQPRPPNLSKELKEKTIRYLFPAREYIDEYQGSDDEDEIEIPVTDDELLQAAEKLRPKKAPGPDGVPAEAIKLFAKHQPKMVCQVFDRLFKVGDYPASWRISKLVLFRKGNKPFTEPSSYRPICLLDSIGKLYEQVIANRLIAAIKCHGDLSCRQFGFRKGRSTVMAINEVTKIARQEMKATLKNAETLRPCAIRHKKCLQQRTLALDKERTEKSKGT